MGSELESRLAALLLGALLATPEPKDRELVVAAETGDTATAHTLLINGARPGRAWKTVTVSCLVQSDGGGTNTETRKLHCESALALAIMRGHEDTVRELLAYGDAPNGQEDWYIPGFKVDQGRAWSQREWEKGSFPIRYVFSSPLALALGRGANITDETGGTYSMTAETGVVEDQDLNTLANQGFYLTNKPGDLVLVSNPVSLGENTQTVLIKPKLGILRALVDAGAEITDEVLQLANLHTDRRFVEFLEDQLSERAKSNAGSEDNDSNSRIIMKED
ncbi:hypothetical protein HDU93_003796 [Gonapodya sp. JEL0774]|nr:hypothetical protein HDU93_003796 [Gonapodya sp. JEL0774]